MFTIDKMTLKEIRQDLGYKKADMVVYLRYRGVDCSLTSLTNWESGVNSPTDEKIQHIIDFIESKGYDGVGDTP